MNDMDDKLIQAFADAFFAHLKHGDEAHQKWLREETDKFFAEKAPAFRSAILADAAKDVKPWAWSVTCDGEHVNNIHTSEIEANRGKRNLDRDFQDHTREVVPLVPASTLAAAQALNAELVARVEGLEKDAARYRHLRGHRGMEHDSFAVHSTLTDDLLWGDDLDHEIDRIAAIAARSGT